MSIVEDEPFYYYVKMTDREAIDYLFYNIKRKNVIIRVALSKGLESPFLEIYKNFYSGLLQ